MGMSPYTQHHNGQIFPEPLKFNPDRWLDNENIAEMKDGGGLSPAAQECAWACSMYHVNHVILILALHLPKSKRSLRPFMGSIPPLQRTASMKSRQRQLAALS